MALHEIGYLIIGGVFQCWFWSPLENTCPNAEKISPAGITREKESSVESREVRYDESGFAVFQRKGDSFELRKKTGEKIRLDLQELNSQTQKALPKTVAADDIKNSLWRYESLEEILKSAMISHKYNILPLLMKDDLKTPLVVSKEQLDSVRQARINKILKDGQLELPIGYIVTSANPGKAPAYMKPDRNSEKVLDVFYPAEKSEELLIYEEHGDWIRMKLVVLEKSKRIVWLDKKDIPLKIVRLNQADRVKTLLEFLSSQTAGSSDENRSLIDSLKVLIEQPLDLDIDAAGETKWSGGILWVKVNVRSELHCSGEEDKSIATGWLPYIDPKTKNNFLSWASRGC